jgi:hypothetical protein
MVREEINQEYRGRVKENESLLARLKRRQFRISMLRLAVFAGGALAAVTAFSLTMTAGVAVIILFTTLFLLLVKHYTILSEKIWFTENLVRINKSEINALEGDYTPFDGGSIWKARDHDFSNDTDLFGEDSLFRYLNRTVTGYGREILAGWLSDPYALRNRIKARQEAVNELAEKITWRQEFMAYGLGKPLEKEDVESLRRWLDEKESFFSSPVLRTVIRISPILTTGVLILASAGLVRFEFAGLFFFLNLTLTGVYLKKSNRVHAMVSKKYIFLSSFEKLITAFGKEKFRAQILAETSARLYSGNPSAEVGIKELSRIIQAFDSRLNLFAGFILNGLILWDFQCLSRLERWKLKTTGQLPLWLEAIGEADALISLSNNAFNNPDFVFPEISEGEPVIEATDMGHPLIDPKVRICNDFSMSRIGLICIVTGANMAGKSTLLRTIAVNLILGMAGTKVCAGKFRFKPVVLFSSMRTTDSLSSNESYFYAELKRLKILKDRLYSDPDLFFILDEILKGTNSEDKSTGSKMFLGKLAERNGTGIIATHDISLGEMEKAYPQNIFNKCFEVEIRGESVIFDYKLRDGITKHMNAGILMRQMGII